MQVKSIHYVKSSPSIALSPNQDGKKEIVFLGRSNVGKSSLINYLANKKNIAYVSKTPGKTIYFNYYEVNHDHYWVDMPGYGFAKVAQSQRNLWMEMWVEFVEKNKHLVLACLLLDSRVPLQKADEEMIDFLVNSPLPWAIVLTKTEKVKPLALQGVLNDIHQFLSPHTSVPYFITSASSKMGKEELLSYFKTRLFPT